MTIRNALFAIAAAMLPAAVNGAPIDLAARGLVLGDEVFSSQVSVDYFAQFDLFQAATTDFSALLDGNPLVTNTVLELAPLLNVELSASGTAVGIDPGLVEVLAGVDLATGAFAGIGPFVLTRVTGSAIDLGGNLLGVDATLQVFRTALVDQPIPIPLPATAPLLMVGLAGLVALRRQNRISQLGPTLST